MAPIILSVAIVLGFIWLLVVFPSFRIAVTIFVAFGFGTYFLLTSERGSKEQTAGRNKIVAIPAAPNSPTSGPNKKTELVPRWGMQLTANWSEDKAWATYRLIQKQYAALIGDREPIVVRSRGIGLGSDIRYNIRIADDDRAYLEKLCRKLIAAGGACVVLRNDIE